jgi:hypothetical protein
MLGVRAVRYQLDGLAPGAGPIGGLSVRVRGHAETPLWHLATGLYGFLKVPPGPATIEVTDPALRLLPAVVTAQVPDRSVVRDALGRCEAPPVGAVGPLLLDLAVRPTLGMPLPPATTALWGLVTEVVGGLPVPGALLRLDTVHEGSPMTATTLSGPDGSWLLVLPGEVIDRATSPPGRNFDRALAVFSPRPPLAADLAQDYVAGLPADVFAIDPAAPSSPLRPRDFQLRAANGQVRPRSGGQSPATTVSIGERVRWDVELLA